MNELTSSAFSVIREAVPIVSALIAVYMGWKLGTRSERMRRASELLEKRFDAFRHVKKAIDDIPQGTTLEALVARANTDSGLLRVLENQVVRLFGLRIELMPYLDEKIAAYLDQQMRPLFSYQYGEYDLSVDMEKEFAQRCIELVREIDRWERELIALHQKIIT